MYERLGTDSLRNLVLCAHFLPEQPAKTICNDYYLTAKTQSAQRPLW